MSKVVVSIGTATQDVYLTGDSFKPFKDGKKSYERFPLGEKITVKKAIFTTGGNAGNAAVTFSRQGLNSHFVGAVGNDPAGSAVKKDLAIEEVGLRHFIKSDEYETSYSVILLATNGERTILRSKGNSYKYLEKFDFEKIKADYAYISSLGEIETLQRVVSELHENDVKIAFNPGSRELNHPKDLQKLLPKIHILNLNKDEAKLLFEKTHIVSIIKEAVELVDYFVMTDGPNGVIASDGKEVVRAGMYDDVTVVDRLGAGDAFGSGFTASIIKGKALAEAVTFASANSTSVIQYIGAKEGILSNYARIHDMELEVKDLN